MQKLSRQLWLILIICGLTTAACTPVQGGPTAPDAPTMHISRETSVELSYMIKTMHDNLANEVEFGIYYRQRSYPINAPPPSESDATIQQ